jgi:hypothetical protein
MVEDKFTDQLIATDIIVWNKVISRWGSVKEFYREGDLIRMANEQEIEQYKEKQNG